MYVLLCSLFTILINQMTLENAFISNGLYLDLAFYRFYKIWVISLTIFALHSTLGLQRLIKGKGFITSLNMQSKQLILLYNNSNNCSSFWIAQKAQNISFHKVIYLYAHSQSFANIYPNPHKLSLQQIQDIKDLD